MYLIPKIDIYDTGLPKDMPPRILFSKGRKYEVEDTYRDANQLHYIVYDNQRYRNYITAGGSYMNQFLIG